VTRRALCLATAAGFSASLLLASCGGDGDGLSREEFVAEADAICAEYDQRVQEIEQPQGLDDVERYADEAQPVIEEGMTELRELEPPEELQDDWNAFISSSEESLDFLDELREAGAAGDPERIQEIAQEVSAVNDEANGIARELGLEDCGDEE
jgi:hypothetical protein